MNQVWALLQAIIMALGGHPTHHAVIWLLVVIIIIFVKCECHTGMWETVLECSRWRLQGVQQKNRSPMLSSARDTGSMVLLCECSVRLSHSDCQTRVVKSGHGVEVAVSNMRHMLEPTQKHHNSWHSAALERASLYSSWTCCCCVCQSYAWRFQRKIQQR